MTKIQAPNMNAKVRIATITGAHGVKGLVKIKNGLDNPANIKTYKTFFKENGDVLLITFNTANLAKVDGIESREAAGDLRGTGIYINRSDLPDLKEGEYYVTDLIGKEVIFEDGKGTITNVLNYGASDIFEVDKKYMIAFAPDFVTIADDIKIHGKKEDFV